MKRLSREAVILLAGEAGQGVQTIEDALSLALKRSGYHVFASKEYMSRVRGGFNSVSIRVASHRVAAPVDRADIVVPLSDGALNHVADRLGPETIVLSDATDPGLPGAPGKRVNLPFTELARSAGGEIYANIAAAAALGCLFGVAPGLLEDYIRSRFASKGEAVVGENLQALAAGSRAGGALLEEGKVAVAIEGTPAVADEVLLNGGTAVAIGALAGGCDFISSYPMTPSTSVLTFLAQKAADFGIVAEQAEDEIAAVNMALGAWYAGARAMVTTSGGGFALMAEGLSLAGMHELPLVVHLAQRPGPATGLPTRTEQGDLLFAVHAGHGEFPRAVYAPGTIEEAYFLTARAFDVADRFQIPVLVLTDQHLIDSYSNLPAPDPTGLPAERHIVPSDGDYRRYRFTESGLSPRAIPGHGEGLVALDSDEHDEEGHITEDLALRVRMVDKRLGKYPRADNDIIPPTTVGDPESDTLVVCWGSTFHAVREALEVMGRDDIALVHFSQVFPLHASSRELLGRARRRILVENNATAQFGRIIAMETGISSFEKILKYSGLPFTVEELAGRLSNLAEHKDTA